VISVKRRSLVRKEKMEMSGLKDVTNVIMTYVTNVLPISSNNTRRHN